MIYFETPIIELILSHTVFVLVSILLILQWTHLWQLKEYRIDRMRDFFATPSGRRALFDVPIAFGVASFLAFAWGGLFWYSVVALLQVVVLIVRRVKPKWTGKALSVSTVALVIVLALAAFTAFVADTFIGLPLLALLAPIVVAILVALLHPVTMWQRRQVITSAHKKIQALQTTVIGITGSYGKSTTKEFLKAMLAERYTVLATPKNINVDIGVAQVILNELREDHDFFVVEMGAYRPGEIDATCRLTSPIIGVLTAVSDQHLSLYGSLEAIKHTKGELLRALPPGGLAVVNKDVPAAVEVAEQAASQVKFFSAQGYGHAYASDVVVDANSVSCVLNVGEESIPVRAQLFGGQVLPAILAAATVARHVGCTMQEIAHAIEALEPVDGTMQVKHGKMETVVIDDHYNSNPDGFLAALDYLAVFENKRKIVLTPGMYELGVMTQDHHHTVASRIAEVADVMLVTKDDFATHLVEGARAAGMPETQMHSFNKPALVKEWLAKNVRTGDVILLEGRVHSAIVDYLLHN